MLKPLKETGNPCPRISFIIPTLNEEGNIINAINSIKRTMGPHQHQIIIADNGSKDNTVRLARSRGAKVIIDTSATIGGLRNLGALSTTDPIIVFIDADVELEDSWFLHLSKEYKLWPSNNLIITGSTCRVPNSSSFIEKFWFSKHQDGKTNYINSGHLITTSTLFNKISGFDTSLKSSEDYELCQRAKKNGALLKKSDYILAFHHGYPKTIINFIARESWHGKEDFSSFLSFFSSKTAIASVVNTALIIVSIASFLITSSFTPGIFYIILSFALCIALTIKKFNNKGFLDLLTTSFCFQLYLAGRFFSLFRKTRRPAAREKSTN